MVRQILGITLIDDAVEDNCCMLALAQGCSPVVLPSHRNPLFSMFGVALSGSSPDSCISQRRLTCFQIRGAAFLRRRKVGVLALDIGGTSTSIDNKRGCCAGRRPECRTTRIASARSEPMLAIGRTGSLREVVYRRTRIQVPERVQHVGDAASHRLRVFVRAQPA